MIRSTMQEVPFERKLEMCARHGLSIENVQAIFNHADTIEMFEEIVAGGRDPNQVYKYMYNIIQGNVFKKELVLSEVLNQQFRQGSFVGQIIDLAEKDKKLSAINAKQLIYSLIDGKYDEPELTLEEIILEEIGDIFNQASIDYDALVQQVLDANMATVSKIKQRSADEDSGKKKKKKGKGGAQGLTMFLVGEVMRLTNKQGDPKTIEQLIKIKLEAL